MKTIIAGGRDYRLTDNDYRRLMSIEITEVVSGGARGADRGGELYAKASDIPLIKFPADWDKHGKAAGCIRNREMAIYADAAVLFPGGRGTSNMRTEAIQHGLKIFDFTNQR